MRGYNLFAATATLGLAAGIGAPAQAGLIGTGTNTVVIDYEFPGGLEIEGNGGAPDTIAIGSGGVTVPEGALDGASITLTDTQIIIKNFIPAEFCDTPGQHPCADAFNGFEFKFSSGVDITGATTDAASAADFRPTGSGIDLASSTDLLIDVAGDSPLAGDELIIDLAFPASSPPPPPPPSVPEPGSLWLLGAGLAALHLTSKIRPRRG
jgi:hypothetical protein